MSYRIEKETTGDAVVFSGFEKGIAPSPHEGVGMMTGVDINTEQDEVMVSYSRSQQSQINNSSGTITQINTNTVSFTGSPRTGSWIVVTGSTITGLSNGNYYVLGSSGKLSATYSTSNVTAVTGMGSGTANWSSGAFDMSTPVQGGQERYVDTTGATQYRYYVLDVNGRLWVRDTISLSAAQTPLWFLPYTPTITGYGGGSIAYGLGVLNGFIFIFGANKIFTISTSQLGTAPQLFSAGSMMSPPTSTNPHFAYVGHQGRLYYTDGNYMGSIFPDVTADPAIVNAIPNIQSYCSYVSATTTGTITAVLNGSQPTPSTTGTPNRIPAYFLPGYGATLAAALTSGDKYYIQYLPASPGTFEVYAAQTGGSAIDISTGASGHCYFNTFFPQSGAGNDTFTFEPQRVGLPSFEIGTCIAELSNTIILGTQSNYIYTWNQVDPTPNEPTLMPESNTAWMVTVNNVVYLGAGVRGNIYITNGSSISLALKVPDYCSGLIEPYFTWGGAMFLRGRVWFSIQDQNSSHTGQCGGIWSFIPAQNFSYGVDVGLALRMDNENSYGSFNGKAIVLIPYFDQGARGPQYYSAWISSISSPTYGIDGSNSSVSSSFPAIIQTDIAPVGTVLNKYTPKQIEYKLSVPLDNTNNPESVSVAWRSNLNDPFVSAGAVVQESLTALSGYFVANFQNVQWLQLQITLTPNGDDTTSFVRLYEVRVR